MSLIEFLHSRRSVSVKMLAKPGPDQTALDAILRAATRVPDHGKLAPWRIVVIEDVAREQLGEVAAARFRALNTGATAEQVAAELARFTRAPLVLCVLSIPKEGRIPVWEQELSVGAVCTHILHAAAALGYGANWLTEWVAFDEQIAAHMLQGEAGRIAGFIYIGTPTAKPEERPRPELSQVVRYY